jgi:carbonic anhydrase
LEYAVGHLHVPLLVIKGHECCGAVTAAVQHPDLDEGHITAIVRQIAPAADLARASGKTGEELVELATDTFIASLRETLQRESRIIAGALERRALHLVVSKYFMSNGHVEVLSSTF